MATHDTKARLVRAARDAERDALRRDRLIVQAHAEGMSFGAIANAIGWDRSSLARHYKRIVAELQAEEGEQAHGA